MSIEMPEGLKRLKSDLNNRLQKANGTDDRQLRFELNSSIFSLDLMREMAEALEAIEKGPHYAGTVHQVLKKFKEWK